jgi:hypothetical protein
MAPHQTKRIKDGDDLHIGAIFGALLCQVPHFGCQIGLQFGCVKRCSVCSQIGEG